MAGVARPWLVSNWGHPSVIVALRGGGTVQAAVSDHAYLYANMFDKSIVYDLAVLRLAVPGGGATEGLFWPLPHPARPLLVAAFPYCQQLLRSPSSRSLCSDQGTCPGEGPRRSQALPQLGLCPFLKLSSLLIHQIFIEHLLLCLYLSLSIPHYICISLYSTYYAPALSLTASHIIPFNPSSEIGAIIDPNLQREKLRYSIAQSYIAREYRSWNSNPGSLVQTLHFCLPGFVVYRCCVSTGATGVSTAHSP